MRPDRLGGIVEPVGLVLVSFDQNRDAILETEEFYSGVAELFRRADNDADGVMTNWELRAFSETHLGSEYAVPGRLAFDPDGNSIIEESEFITVFYNQFLRLDANYDGQLVRSELIRQINFRTNRSSGNRQTPGGRQRGGGQRRRG